MSMDVLAQTSRAMATHKWLAVMLMAVLTVSVLSAVQKLGGFQAAELMAFDWQLRTHQRDSQFADQFLIVGVDESDIQELGYPISDEYLAQALAELNAKGAATIGVDIFRDLPLEGRETLERVASESDSIVFINKQLGEPVAFPDLGLGALQKGFADIKQDVDGRIRRALLMVWDRQGEPHFSFALQVTLNYLVPAGVFLTPDPEDPFGVYLGQGRLPRFQSNDGAYVAADDGGYQVLMDYGAGGVPFQQVTLSDVLNGDVPQDWIQGKIALIGMSASSTSDQHETPLSTGWGSVEPMDGVVLHAHVIDQLLRLSADQSDPVSVLSDSDVVLVAFLLSISGAVIGFIGIRLHWQLLGVTLGLSAIIVLVFKAFGSGKWFPLVFWCASFLTAFLGAGIWTAQRERKEKRLVMGLFGKYTSPDVAKVLWQHRDEFMQGHRPRPQRVTATVLITDLQGFTSPSSKMPPDQVMEWINRYMEAMTEVAIRHGGFVDDYAGDGLKVDFGVPIARQNLSEIKTDASNAVECALEMGDLVTRLNLEHPEDPPLRLRAGINTGDLVVGSVGSDQRMKYTTVGDAVNTAARLESFQKDQFKTETKDFRLLISHSTQECLDQQFAVRHIGSHTLKGHESPTQIYRVSGHKDAQPEILEAV